MKPSLDALMAGETLADWLHVMGPLDAWGVYETVTEGLIAVKQERLAALATHDHERAAALMPEVIDLTYLAGEIATGLALQRARYIDAGHAWPLG